MLDLNVKNFLLITLVAILGIVLFKVVFTKYPISGISEFVQSV